MRAVQITTAGGDFEVVGRDVPTPTAGQVRIRVEAGSICHSDAFERVITNRACLRVVLTMDR